MSRPRELALRFLPWTAPLALLPAFLGAIATAASWPIVHDLPLMVYAGFLMNEHGLVPYRDFFEMNPPGTLYFYSAYHSLFGSDADAFRIVHLSWLAAVLAAVFLFLKRWSPAAGVVAAMCFVVAYVGTGRDSAFQREFLLTLPLAWSFVVAFPTAGVAGTRSLAWRAFAIGLLFGLAATIKPPAALGWPIVMVGFVLAHGDGTGLRRLLAASAWRSAGWTGLGFALPLAALASVLAAQNALAPFLEMAAGYWPLYREVAGDGRVLGDGMAAFAAAQTVERVREFPYLAAACLGVAATFTARATSDPTRAAAVLMLFAQVLAWVFYLFYGGKTWYYHAQPLYLSLSLVTGLGVVFLVGDERRDLVRGGAAAAVFFILLALPIPRQSKPLDLASIEEVAAYLVEHRSSEDRVLPIDVASGALHAMLLAEAPVAGSFLYSFHFLHHTDTPYIQALREKQLAELRSGRPRFVIRAVGGWQIQGDHGDARFAGLDDLLARHYRLLPLRNRGQLELLERIGPSGPVGDGEPGSLGSGR